MDADLTHAEALEAFRALAKAIGPKCEIFASLNTYGVSGGVIYTSIYPRGITSSLEQMRVVADGYRETIEKVRAAWAERVDTHAAHTIREMALAIISITADQGECTDAALRAKFDAADVARYGERACAEATEIAGLGPFSIVTLSGANDAEAA